MARVLLIHPHNDRDLGKPTPDPTTPLSLIYVGTAVEDKHPVKIYDRNIYFDDGHLLNTIKEYNPDIIGLSSITTKMLLDMQYVARLIKKNFPKKIIIVGGIHATIAPESLLREKEFDYILRGEGEAAFLDFCNTYDKNPKKLKDLENINRNPLRPFININDLKLPNYSLVELEKYERAYVSLSRGCPGNCTFCYSCKMWGKDGHSFVRTYTTEKAIELFKDLLDKYKVKKFSIADDNFVPFKSRAIEICNFLKPYKISFFCFGRADYLDDEIMPALKSAGCHTIFIGGESGSQRMLDFINKRTKVEQNAKAIKICKKYGITSDVSFMIGMPTETIEDLNMTKNFIKKYRPDIVNTLIFNPMPGTPIYEYCLQKNLIKPPVLLEEWANWTGDLLQVRHNVSEIPDKVLTETLNELNMIGFYKYKIKKFFYWVKAGEVGYAFRGIKRVFFENGKFSIPGLRKTNNSPEASEKIANSSLT